MKKIVLCVAALAMTATTVFAAGNKACMKDTAGNQAMVEEYAIKVMKDPKKRFERPSFYTGNCKSDAPEAEARAAAEKIFKMAEAGLTDKIEMPKFRLNGSE